MKKKSIFLFALLVSMLLIPWHLKAQVLNENFDNLSSGIPAGWTVEGTASDSYKWQTTKAYSSSYYSLPKVNDTEGLYFYSWSASGKTSNLKTPVFNLVGKNTHFLTFDYVVRDYSEGTLYVIVSKDGGVTPSDTIFSVVKDTEPSNTYISAEISLAAYDEMSNLCVIFAATGAGGYWHCLDNVKISPAPTCAKAADLNAISITQTDATLTWKTVSGIPAASDYEVKVIKVGAKVADDTLTFQATSLVPADGVYSYTLEGELNPSTQYYFTIQGICGAEDKAEIVKSSNNFYTLCDAYDLPISFDLRTISSEENPFMPCWTTNGTLSYPGTESGSISLDYYSSDDYLYLISPQINFAANDIAFEFEYDTYAKSGFTYGVASSSDLADMDTLGHVDLNDESGLIVLNTAATKFGTATGKMLVILFDNGEPNIYSIKIYDKPCCPRPVEVRVNALDSASLQISWLGSATKYNVVLTDTVANKVIRKDGVTTNPVVVDGLIAATNYLVQVQAVCAGCGEEGADGVSELSDSVFCATMCGVAENAEFTENFEYYSELGDVLPACWIENVEDAWVVKSLSGATFVEMSGYAAESGKTTTLVSQAFKVTTAGQYDVAFDMYRHSGGYEGEGELTVWVNNRPDTIGATKIATINRNYKYTPAEKTSDWHTYEYNIPTKTGVVYLVFEGESTSSNSNPIRIDNVKVYPKPACRKVREITLGAPTTTTIPVNWVADEDQSSWILNYVVLAGADTIKSDSLAVTSLPYTIAGLPSSTTLTIKGTVTANCGDVDGKSEAVAFDEQLQTACAPFALPFFEGFESTKFAPLCWATEQVEGSGSWTRTTSYRHTGSAAAQLNDSYDGTITALITPELDVPEKGVYRISYWINRHTYGKDGEGIRVYINSVPEVTDDAYELGYVNSSVDFDPEGSSKKTGWCEIKYDIDVKDLDVEFKYVIFEGNSKYYSSSYIDDIFVGVKPEVEIIWDFGVDSITHQSANIVISDTTVAVFDLAYGAPGFDPTAENVAIVDSIVGRTYKFTNLKDDSEYEVYVRSRKGNKVSEWSSKSINFHTLCLPFVVTDENPYIESFEDYNSDAYIAGCMFQNPSEYYKAVTAKQVGEVYVDGQGWVNLEINPTSGEKMAYLSYPSSSGSWLFRAVELKAGVNYSVSADVLASSSTYYTNNIMFGIAPSPERSKVNKLVQYDIANIQAGKDWTRYAGYFTVKADGVYYIGIASSSYQNICIDSLVLRTEVTIPPAIEFSEILDTTATFVINSDADAWDFFYSTETFIPDSLADDTLFAVTTKTFTIDTLQPSTKYYYAFRSKKDTLISAWAPVESFTTECVAFDSILVQSFESSDPGCWTLIGSNEFARRAYSSYDIGTIGDGAYSGYLSESRIISPRAEGNFVDHKGSFVALNYYDGADYQLNIVVGVMNNLLDPSSYLAISDTIKVEGFHRYNDDTLGLYTFDFSVLNDPKYADYVDAKYFVFDVVKGSGFVDALRVEPDSLAVPAAPRFNPEPDGIYVDSVLVSLETISNNNVEIYYALGDTVTLEATKYTAPLKVAKDETISAIAVRVENGAFVLDTATQKPIVSEIVTVSYDVESTPAAPVFKYESGYFVDEVLDVEISTTDTRKAHIIYTVDGTEPTVEAILAVEEDKEEIETPEEGDGGATILPLAEDVVTTASAFLYASPIKLAETDTIKAIVALFDEEANEYVKDITGRYVTSAVASAIYTAVEVPAVPVVTPESGVISDAVTDTIQVSIDVAEGTFVKYTVNKAEETLYTAAFKLFNVVSDTVQAIAYMANPENPTEALKDVKGNVIASEVKVVVYNSVATPAAPVFKYESGYFVNSLNAEISVAETETRKAYIFCTNDGTDPDVAAALGAGVEGDGGAVAPLADDLLDDDMGGLVAGSTTIAYPGSLSLTQTTTIKAVVALFDEEANDFVKDVYGNYIVSAVASATYTAVPAPAKPIIEPVAGNYVDSVEVSISTAEGTLLQYALAGKEMAAYTDAFVLTANDTVSAVAYMVDPEDATAALKDVHGNPIVSEKAVAVYNIYALPAAPIFAPEAGEYIDSVAVTLTCETENVVILYDITGLQPSFASPRFEGEPIIVKSNATIAAMAVLVDADGEPILDTEEMPLASELVSAAYTIKVYELPEAPEFTPEAGEFEDSVVVVLSCATEGTAIYYVLEDTVPTIASAKYAEELVIRETTTIAAVAALVDTLGNPILNGEELPYVSEVVRATYVIKIGNNIDNIELAAVVYAKGGIVYVDTEIGNMIEVYTVQGQRLYAAEATASLTAIDALGSDVVLVRVNGTTVKISIR